MENESIECVLNKIILKAKYNEETKKYEIKESDYLHFELTSKQKNLLKKICNKLGINLEYTPYTKDLLPAIEDVELFKEYNQILDEIEIANEEEKEKLELRRIELRNKIWTDNFEFAKSIILRRINKQDKSKDIDDLIQTAYEIMLEYIDKNHLYKGIFKDQISKILLIYTSRRIISDNENFGSVIKNYLERINGIKDKENTTNIEKIAKATNLKKEKVETLLMIDSITNPISIEEQIALINSRELNDDSLLYDNTFEKQLIDKQRRDIILKIIKTLPKVEQEMIILYFGFNGQTYTMDEIGKTYNLTKSYVSSIINKALNTIRTTIRINYLQEIYDGKGINLDIDTKSNQLLEEFLIRNLPQDVIEYVKEHLNDKSLIFFELYTTNKNYKLKELSEKLNIHISQTHKLKKKTLDSVRYIIINLLINQKKEKITYEDYLDYLMKLWINKGYSKRRVR